MTAEAFRHWRQRKAYTLDTAARALGSAGGWSPTTTAVRGRYRAPWRWRSRALELGL